MNYLLRIFVFLIVITPFSYVYADQADTELTKLLNSVSTMQANFSQVIYDNHGKASQKSSGRMAMQRPGKFRWEVKKPIPQLIIANQSRLWIYDPDLEQVSIRPLRQTTGDAPALLLSQNDIVLDKSYKVKQLQKRATLSWFLLSSRHNGNMFVSIRMGFKDNQIQEMQLLDHLGHTTIIVFQNAKTNVSLPANEFIFHPPKNVDVIDETQKK